MIQFLSLGIVTKIGRQALSLRAVSAMLELIPFVRLVVRTIRVLEKMVAIFVLDMASQATESKIVPSQVIRVSRTVPQLSPVAQTSRIPPPALLVGNSQTKFMLFSSGKIKKILLIWLLVHYRSFTCMFMHC